MNLLLDTHALIWWLSGDGALSRLARDAIEDRANVTFVSAATAWEITTKYRIGKLPSVAGIVAGIVADIEGTVTSYGFKPLAVSMRHGQLAGTLPGDHRDPFDRMLMAQAMLERLVLVSNEVLFDRYGPDRLW